MSRYDSRNPIEIRELILAEGYYVPYQGPRRVIGRLAVWIFVVCTFSGLLSIIFYDFIGSMVSFSPIFPKIANIDLWNSLELQNSSNVLWINLIIFSTLYFFLYVLAIPVWVSAALNRQDWSDFKFKWQTFVAVVLLAFLAGLEVYECVLGDTFFGGVHPKLTQAASLRSYTRFQVIALMGIANFLLFPTTLIMSGKIFGRKARR